MKKTISLFIMTNSGQPVRQVTVSKALLRLCFLAGIAFMAYAGYVLYDYNRLQYTLTDARQLHAELNERNSEISGQRQQIQQFAKEINQLKAKLVSLNEFETKIRVIANLEKTNDQVSLFGIGGSIPQDLDARVPLTNQHNSLVREMHEQARDLDEAVSRQSDNFTSLLSNLEDQVNLLASTPAIRPVNGWKTSGFGYRNSPFTGLREFHKGLDIATRKGTPIQATADGTVTFVGRKGLLGKVIVLDHGYGMVTRYGHCDGLDKKVGDRVRRGEAIATIGSTGRSTGPHLHYEVLLNGIPTNPEKHILN
jgi:murein DD-endopeptidase MepM/ murein hydrolase activator NlpD